MIEFASDVRAQGPRFVSPLRFPQTVGNYVPGAMARAFNIRGPNLTFAAWDASSLVAILEGAQVLADDRADVMLVGGTEAAAPDTASGLFEPDRHVTEGACWFVLEDRASVAARGAVPLAVVRRPGEQADTAASEDAIVSMASTPRDGAIFVTHWTGRCAGASGAAAAAAAIGAARGLHVPVAGGMDGAITEIRVIVDPAPAGADGIPVVVYADDPGKAAVSLALRVPA